MTLTKLDLPPLPSLPDSVKRRAAVAIVVGPDSEALFIRRAERVGDPWSGDMAFPGGRAQPDDATLRHTAERETVEEVGLDLGPGLYRGALDVLYSPLREPDGAFGVVPFVYELDRWPELKPNHEVASTHLIRLDRLFAGEGRGTFEFRGFGVVRELPCVRLDGTFIWGMTLRMLDTLHARLDG